MPCNIKVHLLIYFANAPNDFGHDKKINFNHVIRQTRAVHDDIFLFPLTTNMFIQYFVGFIMLDTNI